MVWCKSLFNLRMLSMPGVSCLWRGLQYNSKLVVYTGFPVCLVFMLFSPLLVVSILERFQRNAEEQTHFMQASNVIKDRFWNAIMLVCFLVSILQSNHRNFMLQKLTNIDFDNWIGCTLAQLYPQLSNIALEPTRRFRTSCCRLYHS